MVATELRAPSVIQCRLNSIHRSQLGVGNWTLRIHYISFFCFSIYTASANRGKSGNQLQLHNSSAEGYDPLYQDVPES